MNVVLFLPQDLTIIEGSPSDRRRYVDLALGQVDPTYSFALSEYGKVLTQRNALLFPLQNRGRRLQTPIVEAIGQKFGVRRRLRDRGHAHDVVLRFVLIRSPPRLRWTDTRRSSDQ